MDQKVKEYFRLTRPLNVFIGMLSIFLGAFVTGTIQPLWRVLLASLSGGLIAAAANAINDYFDVEIDRINKPNRPIASGKMSRKQARTFSHILFYAGILISIFVNWKALIVAVFSSLLLYQYSARLKRTILWGNLSVSLVSALAFIYGGIAVNRLEIALIPAIFSFFYHLGREIIKDTEDIVGDEADGIVTFPIKYGVQKALALSSGIYLFLIALTLVPYFFHIFGIYYLIIVLAVVDLVVLLVLFFIWRDRSQKNLSRLSLILKLNMFAGLIAIYCGQF
ncbi:MAG: UbiA family prenyltransferase [Calditrichaeota bacterium]|nr:UbiA family prenyltransferase [Calditrichota bacterium]